MSTAPAPANIVDNKAEHRFETTVEGHTASLEYKLQGNTIILEHTAVPEELQGRGLAGQLAQAGMAAARERGLSVEPVCPVVFGYIKKHPETKELLTEKAKKVFP
jgi:hypothetical protein